jgi:inner membrane protein
MAGAALVGFLILVLLIPLAMVQGLIDERRATRDAAEREVSEKWGGPQNLGGPTLIVPYRYQVPDAKGGLRTCTGQAAFLPEVLEIRGEIEPEIRYRGIYEVPLFTARLAFRGSFAPPDFTALKIPPSDVSWEDAIVSAGISDMRGIREAVRLDWDQVALDFGPGAGSGSVFPAGVHARVGQPNRAGLDKAHNFAFELELRGSKQLTFLPLGRETRLSLASSWPSPSFMGAFLPDARTVTASGFTADWRLFYLGRSYPQQWTQNQIALNQLSQSSAGVSLELVVDSYLKSTRSAKYGILFLALTFGTFFLFESLKRLAIHPFQYLLVGFALVLFYLLLLSISEHASFGTAYLMAAAATIALIGGYTAYVLQARGRVIGMTTLLGGLYGYLYVLLQLEDYALLLGAVGLFVCLAAVMWITRKVDWYALRA